MQNLKHILLVTKAFDKERDKFLYEIAKVNKMISKRHANIEKITAYQGEYTNTENLKLSRAIPSLSRNIDSFTGKIALIIDMERIEIDKLNGIKNSILSKIAEIDQKIKLMNHFEERAKLVKSVRQEKVEQNSLDDLSSTMHLRGDNE